MPEDPIDKNAMDKTDSATHLLQEEIAKKEARILELEQTIRAITTTRGWRFLEGIRAARTKILPPGTLRHRILDLALRSGRYIRRNGFAAFIRNAGRRYDLPGSFFEDEKYKTWVEKNEPGSRELELQRKLCSTFRVKPKISIVTPVFNPDRKVFLAMLESVLNQTYENWELCLADASTQEYVKTVIEEFRTRSAGRFKVKYLDRNLGITGNSNEALSLVSGDCVALLDHDDVLAPFALYEVAKIINECPCADVIYSDRDIISYDDRRMYPFFKPDWSPDYLLSQNYLCHMIVFRKGLLDDIKGFREGYDGSQDYDLFLRATEAAQEIVHIPKVLYHWRIVPGSASVDPNAKPYAYDAAIRALEDAFQRRGWKGSVIHGGTKGFYDLKIFVAGRPKVLIIILARGGADTLRPLLDSIIRKTAYNNYDVMVISSEDSDGSAATGNNSPAVKIKLMKAEKPAAVCEAVNRAVSETDSEYVAILDGAVEIRTEEWLGRMLGFAQRPDTGAVGGKLLDPAEKIISAGLILGRDGKVLRSHQGYGRDESGYNGKIQSVHNVSAVSGCIVMRKKIFEEAGGLDPRFESYYAVDLCLELRRRNLLIVYEPRAELVIGAMPAPGVTETERLEYERKLLFEKWGDLLKPGDPYYSPNLTQASGDFSIRTGSD